MNDRKLQVFISSTYEDMKAERHAAVEAVLEAGHIPAGMELFSAGSFEQLEIINRWIDSSDVYMLLLGGRYGSIEPKSSCSYIECEYEYAVSKGMPFFALVISDDFLDQKVKTSGRSVIEQSSTEKYNAFKKTVLSRISAFFNDLSSLKMETIKSLNYIKSQHKLAGWVRGDIPNYKFVGEVKQYYYGFLNPMKYKLGAVVKTNKRDNTWNTHVFRANFDNCGNIRWIYGPYRKLPHEGNYKVTFRIRLDNRDAVSLPLDTDVLVLDVYDYNGNQKKYREEIIKLCQLDKIFKEFDLCFNYDNIHSSLEYRIGVISHESEIYSISLDGITVRCIN